MAEIINPLVRRCILALMSVVLVVSVTACGGGNNGAGGKPIGSNTTGL